MPRDKASRRNKSNRWDDELEEFHSSTKDERKVKTGIHTNRKERVRSKQADTDLVPMGVAQAHWLETKPPSPVNDTSENEPVHILEESASLSLTEIRELSDRLKQLSDQTARLMESVRACGIDFGLDMDRQFSALVRRRSDIEAQIQDQGRLYNQESIKLQQSLGKESARVIAEMIHFETKKQSIYHDLQRQCKRLFTELQAFHEGVEGLAWNLDQCR